MTLLVVACLAGIFFGLFYKFLVLIPLTLAAAITCGSAAALHGQTVSAVLFAIVVPAVGLQGGYMIGLTGRELLSQFIARINVVVHSRRV
jgi:hypothetical protein